jgi:hypothetical protein
MSAARLVASASLLVISFRALGAPPEVQVRVTNPTTQPIPVVQQGVGAVVGDVNVTNTPTVDARQNGPWDVGVPAGVRVTNGAASPVPVGVQGTPSVSVVSSVPIAVTQGGTWPVIVQGTPTVALAAGTTVTATVVDPGQGAFQAEKLVYHDENTSTDAKLVISGPAGSRLVVETVSAVAGMSGDVPANFLSVATTVGGVQASTYYPMQASGYVWFQFFPLINAYMKAYVVPATQVRVYSDPTAADPTKHELSVGCGPAGGVTLDFKWQCRVTVSGRFLSP